MSLVWFGFALLRSAIGQKNSHHLLNQSITNRVLVGAFSRAFSSLFLFWALIGWWWCKSLCLLVIVITLVSVFWHLLETAPNTYLPYVNLNQKLCVLSQNFQSPCWMWHVTPEIGRSNGEVTKTGGSCHEIRGGSEFLSINFHLISSSCTTGLGCSKDWQRNPLDKSISGGKRGMYCQHLSAG